jgi:WD40 repeat protein
VSRIFVSHSSADNRQTLALAAWLSDVRPELASEIFIDNSAETGLRPGQRWQEALRQASDRCEVVICLVSRNWIGSDYCRLEYLLAENLGKQIIVARLEDLGDADITSKWQRCDLFADGAQIEIAVPDGPSVRFSHAALDQLKKAIEGTGVGPEHFAWPPGADPRRAPYRGWEPFEDIDAGVFFGRDAAIVRGTDELRSMRNDGVKSLFVVLGPSGSGKSSFLRAGLIPRLQRDDLHFLTLAVMRPERDALTGAQGLAAAIYSTRERLHLPDVALGEIKRACPSDPNRIAALFGDLRAAAATRLAAAGHQDLAPTLVLPVDQAEELFSADAGSEADQFLILITELMQKLNVGEVGLIVVATIRTDRYEAMQNHPALHGVGAHLFNELKPMSVGHFSQVITGPAVRASHGGHHLAIAPALVNRLMEDAAEGADSLPLLALTLARLYADYGTEPEITLAHYEGIGGIRHVIEHAINEVLAPDPERRTEQLALLREAFIGYLATINPANDQPMRRVARYVEMPADSRPLIDALVEQRLLVKDERAGETVVEVALESLLRQWDELAGWLREERNNLIAADDIERSATAWRSHDDNPAWLLTGNRLTDAEVLSNTKGFSGRLNGARDYLTASRQAENQRLAKEEEQRRAELRHARQRTRYAAVIALIAVIGAVAAIVGFVQANRATHRAQASANQATALRLISEASEMLSGAKAGGDVRAFQEFLAAHALAGQTADGGLLNAVAQQQSTAKIFEADQQVESVVFSRDGSRLAFAAGNRVQLLDAHTFQPVGQPLEVKDVSGRVLEIAFSPDGRRLAAGDEDQLLVWKMDAQPVPAPLRLWPTRARGYVNAIAFSPDGRRIATASYDGTLGVWDADNGKPLSEHALGTLTGDLAFSPDLQLLASGMPDDTVRLWNVATGQPALDRLSGPSTRAQTLTFSSDGHRLAATTNDATSSTVRLWSVDTGQLLFAPIAADPGNMFACTFSHNGHLLAAGDNNDVRLWNADTGQPIDDSMTGHTDVVKSLAFSADDRQLVTGSWDNTVRLWSMDSGQPLTGHTGGVTSVAFSPDGHHVASGSDGDDDSVRLWDNDTGRLVGSPLTGHDAEVTNVAFSLDGHRLVSVDTAGSVLIWSTETGRLISSAVVMQHHREQLFGATAAISPDGHKIAVGTQNNTVTVSNAETGRTIAAWHPVNTSAPIGPAVATVAFSADGRRVATYSYDNAVRWWNPDTGQSIDPPLNVGRGRLLALSPDGHRLVVSAADNALQVWDIDRGAAAGALLIGHTGSVNSAAFDTTGKRLVTGSSDNKVRLWKADTGESIGEPFTGHSDGVSSVAFSPDGRRVASGGGDKTVRLWPAVATPKMLCDKLTTNMSHNNWRSWVSPDIPYVRVCTDLPVAPD